MALTSRAKRNTDLVHKSLPEFIGPGSYDTAFSRKSNYGQAPFGSTAQRIQYAKAAATPGPGSYSTFPKPESAGKPQPSSVFLSKAPRMLSEVELPKKARDPGPGSYNVVTGGWKKTVPSVCIDPTVPAGVNWVKVSSAPSIPTIAQSYGYEQGPHGSLVQQKAPISGFAGTERDCVGPGSYDPDAALSSKNRGVKFGKSQAGRDCFNLPKEVFTRPGPGEYEAKIVPAEDTVRPSAIFMSATVPTKNIEKHDTPGPGYYEKPKLWKTVDDMMAHAPETSHAFGSTSRKPFKPASEQHPVPLNNIETPGPGTYDNATKATAPKQRVVVMSDSNLSHGAFDSTAPRFSPSKETWTATPGPGYYIGEKDGLVGSLQRRLIGRYGVFGTTSQRFSLPTEDPNVGPGLYDPPLSFGTEIAKPRKKDRRSAVFASRTKRDILQGMELGDAVPPVGAYAVPAPEWVKKSVNCGNNVLSSSPRFKTQKLADTPGPGAYDLQLIASDDIKDEKVTVPKPPKPCGAIIDTKSPRFAPSDKENIPGPGSYSPSSSLIKKTFNVTIAPP